MMLTSRGEPDAPGAIGPVAGAADVQAARSPADATAAISSSNVAARRETAFTARSLGPYRTTAWPSDSGEGAVLRRLAARPSGGPSPALPLDTMGDDEHESEAGQGHRDSIERVAHWSTSICK